MQTEEKGRPDNRGRDEKVVMLLRHLFHDHYCVAEEVPQQLKSQVLPARFCGWADQRMALMDAEAACEAAKVDLETWQFVRQLLDGGLAPEALFGVWYSIVLSDRPVPKYPVRSINIVVNLTYEDGGISTTQAYADRAAFTNDEGFTDHIVAGLIRNNMRAVLDRMIEAGVDGLHEQAKKNVFTSPEPEDPYEVFMGLIQAYILKDKPLPEGQKFKPALLLPMVNYMRLFQQMVRPVVPKAILDEAKAAQAKADAAARGKHRGGWDA